MNAETVAAAVVRRHFPPRRYAVCQNVSWALLPYEADIIAVTEAGTVHEVEIKTSKADLLADVKKMRWANHPNRLRPQVDFYWLAVPQRLQGEAVRRAEEIGAGVFSVYWYDRTKHYLQLRCEKIKLPRRWLNKDEAPVRYSYMRGTPVAEHRQYVRRQVHRLASLRYWEIVFTRRPDNAEKEEEPK